MKTIDQINRDNLAILVSEYDGVSKLANQLEREPSQVSQWLNASINSGTGKPRGMRPATCRYIESKCEKPAGWMDADRDASSGKSHLRLVEANIEFGPDMQGDVPLISWVSAGTWTLISDPYEPGVASEWLPCPKKHGKNTFALTVRGVSMENPGGKYSYSEGEVIYVDPDRRPENGSRVIVRQADGMEATFKQLVIESDRKYLKALNPSWPEKIIEMDDSAVICGTVIGRWRDED